MITDPTQFTEIPYGVSWLNMSGATQKPNNMAKIAQRKAEIAHLQSMHRMIKTNSAILFQFESRNLTIEMLI